MKELIGLSRRYWNLFAIPDKHIDHLQEVVTSLSDAYVELTLKMQVPKICVDYRSHATRPWSLQVSFWTVDAICVHEDQNNLTELRIFFGIPQISEYVCLSGRSNQLLNPKIQIGQVLTFHEFFDHIYTALEEL